MKRRALSLLLCGMLLTLCACQGAAPSPSGDPAPAASGSQTPSAAPSSAPSENPDAGGGIFVTHWDKVTAPDRSVISRRISDGPLTDFTPAEGYGTVVPYLGSEMRVRINDTPDEDEEFEYGYTQSLYGLCTTDGTILTDPVYHGIVIPSWYDAGTYRSTDLPMWLLLRTAQDEDGEYYTSVGVAAKDGSWYTGQLFEGGISAYIASSPAGVLMKLDDETAVMIGTDGQELFRWTLDDFLPADSEARDYFFTDGLNWTLRCYGNRLYYDPYGIGSDDNQPSRWIDPWTGKDLENPALTIPTSDEHVDRQYFQGGWWENNGETISVTYDDGGTETITLASELGSISYFGEKHIVYSYFDNASKETVYTLTDHENTVLRTVKAGGYLGLITDELTGVSYPYLAYYSDNGYNSEAPMYLLRDDGTAFLSASNWIDVYGGLAVYCDGASYHLTDLASLRDLIRLPRWAAMDLAADE